MLTGPIRASTADSDPASTAGSSAPPFGPGPRRIFDPRFNRGFGRHFDRFEDRFENRFNRGFFNPRFDRFEDRLERRFNRGFFDPRFSPGFGREVIPGPLMLP